MNVIKQRYKVIIKLQIIYFPPGKFIKTISKGSYFDLALCNGQLYAADNDSPTIHVYDCRTWNRLHSISTPCSITKHELNVHCHRICVDNEHIKLSCATFDTVYSIDTKGKLNRLHGPNISINTSFNSDHTTEASKLGTPMICQDNYNGTVLVADRLNDRLLVLTAERQWRRVRLNDRLLGPRDAVLWRGRLYVSTLGDDKLTIFQ